MHKGSMSTFICSMIGLGTAILWFKPLMDVINTQVVPLIWMPAYMILFLKVLPFIVLSALLITSVMDLTKRRRNM